jgi:hypothetical protein
MRRGGIRWLRCTRWDGWVAADFSDADDHDLGGFDEGSGGLAFAELHLAGGVGGDDGGDLLVADLEGDLR